MPCFSKRFRAMRGDLVILDGKDLGDDLDHRHLDAHECDRRRRTRCRWRPSRSTSSDFGIAFGTIASK